MHTEPELRALLDEVRAHGWAFNDQELEPGLRSIAAPVRGVDGTVVAAINISSTTAHNPVSEFRRQLIVTANAISADLAAASLVR